MQAANGAAATQPLNEAGQSLTKSNESNATMRPRRLHAVKVERDRRNSERSIRSRSAPKGSRAHSLEPGDRIVFRYKPVERARAR